MIEEPQVTITVTIIGHTVHVAIGINIDKQCNGQSIKPDQ